MPSNLSPSELDDRIAVLRDNIRQLIEQAAGASGGQNEERTADRIAQQTAELDKLVAEREGLGRFLLDKVAACARGLAMESVLLEVRPSNHRAIRLYERFGFTSIGRRKNYYPARHRSREDAIVMRFSFATEGADGAA